MDDESRLVGIARTALVSDLSAVLGQWGEVDGVVRSNFTIAVLTDAHGPLTADGHVDLGVALNPDRPDTPVIWDCAAGSGATPEARIRDAVHRWTLGTFAAFAELVTQDGRHGEHFSSRDAAGFPGWHTICGPFLITGNDHGAADELLQWLHDHPVLPVLSEVLTLSPDANHGVHGIKVVIGTGPDQDIVEVRVDGREDDAATRRIAGLQWPRSHRSFVFVRMFALVIPEVDPPR